MPINRLLRDSKINPDDVEVLTVAFNLALHELRLVDCDDPLCDIVARKVIEVGTDRTFVRDPQEIANRAAKRIGFRTRSRRTFSISGNKWS
jgi:hypothetical protein